MRLVVLRGPHETLLSGRTVDSLPPPLDGVLGGRTGHLGGRLPLSTEVIWGRHTAIIA